MKNIYFTPCLLTVSSAHLNTKLLHQPTWVQYFTHRTHIIMPLLIIGDVKTPDFHTLVVIPNRNKGGSTTVWFKSSLGNITTIQHQTRASEWPKDMSHAVLDFVKFIACHTVPPALLRCTVIRLKKKKVQCFNRQNASRLWVLTTDASNHLLYSWRP